MWTCTKCSYAYNRIWVENCDICMLQRTPPSLTQPSLITLTKDKAPRSSDQPQISLNNRTEATKFQRTPDATIPIPIAAMEPDLNDDDDDDDAISMDAVDFPQRAWTCKKCTLLNSAQATTCIVCGGSKLKSVSTIEELTLRKGEFWVCTHCTLKNSLSTTVCGACKSVKQISGQQSNFRPYTSTPVSNANAKHTNLRPTAIGQSSSTQAISSGGLTPTVHRLSRSPSPKYDRSSGAIPKVILLFGVFTQSERINLNHFSFLFAQRHSTGGVMVGRSNNTHRHSVGPNTTIPVKVWHCPACTYENSSASVVCDICSSPRGLASTSKSSNELSFLHLDGNSVIETSVDLSRKESKLMENLRRKEEIEARTKWENIIQYCKDVNTPSDVFC